MPRFIEGEDRAQVSLFPEILDDDIGEDNPVRLIEAFVGGRDLEALGFRGVEAKATGRPAYHASTLLKITSTDTSIASPRVEGLNKNAGAMWR